MSSTQSFRPLISSLSFNDQNAYLPLKFNYSLDQIIQIKKYLPKNIFKLHGVETQSENFQLTKQQEQKLQKSKLKIKSSKSISTDNKQKISFVPKQQVRVIEWYNKQIDLRIPYNSKDSQIKIQASIFEHINYYLENFMFFKNTLNEQLYSLANQQDVNLTADQIATQTDLIFTCWNIEPEPNDNTFKVISISMPVVLCLQLNQSYSLRNLKAILKADISNSISIMLKHNFDTRVTYIAQGSKQFICLTSYSTQQNALKEQQKLQSIVKQNKKQLTQVQTQQSIKQASKQKKFLIIILASLMLIYILLKIYPINGRDFNQYFKNPQKNSQHFQSPNNSDQQIF